MPFPKSSPASPSLLAFRRAHPLSRELLSIAHKNSSPNHSDWLLQGLNQGLNTLRPIQNGRHFPDDIFQSIFLNENVWISIKISLRFLPKGPNNNIPALVQIMAWHRPGNKPLSEPMMVTLRMHICITWSQWVKSGQTPYQQSLWNP